MKIIILGADGYLGWPTCMYLTAHGHDVVAVDNYLKRKITDEVGGAPLVEMPRLGGRTKILEEATGRTVSFAELDIRDYLALSDLFAEENPDVILHYGEQPSGPYSMKGHDEASLTLDNNVRGTLNVIHAMLGHCPDAHLVKLGCYSSDTEVLTDRGWVLFTELSKSDKVCCLEPESQAVEYHHPSAIVEYPYEGKMLRAKSKGVDFLVTPNHRVVFKKGNDKKSLGGIEISRADEISDTEKIYICRGGSWRGKEVGTFTIPGCTTSGPGGRMFKKDPIDVPMDKWLDFLGLWLSEGTIRRRGKGGSATTVRISVKKEGTVNAVRKAMNALEIFTVTEYTKPDGCIEFDITNAQLAQYMDTYGLQPVRRIPQELLQLSSRQLEILFAALMEGDGHVATTQETGTEYYFSTSVGLLSDVQDMCLKIGRVGNICSHTRPAPSDRATEHYLSIGTRNLDVSSIGERRSWEDYKGTVHCCTVPTGIIMTRRNGKVCWSGNTMGEYGTPNTDIPEGFFEFEYNGRKDTRLFPREAGSLYHTCKILETDLLHFYVRMKGLRVTDLMQGPVYGTVDVSDPALGTHFHYDGIFGTALNRFVVQAVVGHPLTVYGKGNQTRGYLDIRDTVECVRLACESPVEPGEMRVMNQFTEDFSAIGLAERVREAAAGMKLDVKIDHIDNPRIEKEDHYYKAENKKLLDLGLEPHLLGPETIQSMIEYVQRHRENIDESLILPKVKW